MKNITLITFTSLACFAFIGCEWFKATLIGKKSKAEIARLARIDMASNEILQHSFADVREASVIWQRYHVIVGSYKVLKSTDKMLKLLTDKGYKVKNINMKNGLRFISVSSYETYELANIALNKILKEDFCPDDVWIYDSNTKLHFNL